MKSQAKAFTSGSMEKYTRGSGRGTVCTAKGISVGQMEKCIKVILLKIKGMELGTLNGQMEESTRANGSTVSNMVSETTSSQTEIKKEALGKMAKEQNGHQTNE